MKKKTELIGSASGWGAQIRETEQGPAHMKHRGLSENLTQKGRPNNWAAMVYPDKSSKEIEIPPGKGTLEQIIPHLKALAAEVSSTIQEGHFPAAIGGDHVMAVGTFSGAIQALHAKENFGLIWVDAHMDSHTPQTTPSNAYHGMPVATLMGHGEPQLTDLLEKGPQIRPQDIALIGIRSYEPAEKELLEQLNVKVFYCDEVLERGVKDVLSDAIAHVTRHTKAFGVSIDLDAFDPEYAPGVGSPEPNGMVPSQTLPHLHLLRDHPQFSALEITEFNPERDTHDRTANLVEDLLYHLLPESE